jgi:hypothetical protein
MTVSPYQCGMQMLLLAVVVVGRCPRLCHNAFAG